VLEPDLVHPVMARWLAFSGPAIEAGVRAIFGFPLRVGAVRLGALNLYCDQSRLLSDEQHADALVIAEGRSPGRPRAPGRRAARQAGRGLGGGRRLPICGAPASGMVAAQLDVNVGQALIRLKAHAFGNGRPLAEVAEDVVARKLRFDAHGGKTDA
jgi:hypothetical protein